MTTRSEHAEVSGEIVDLIPALRGYAWVLTRSHQEVDDLVQETLTKALANTHRFQPGTNLRAWLMTIMRNAFYNNAAKRSRERTGSADCISGEVVTQPTQEWTVRCGEVMSVIFSLPAHYREMLVLVVMLGEPYDAAAEITGVAMGTVKSRVNRARAMVVERLGEAGLPALPKPARQEREIRPGQAAEALRRARADSPESKRRHS
jgi:RNA polymerase sigma factor (sigma-70 family)